jgi:hypothetical protein
MPSVSINITLPHIPTSVAAAPPLHSLHGTASGTYTAGPLVVDAGVYNQLSGTATFGTRGTFQVTGSVNGVGMIAQGRAGGELTFTNSRGTITVTLRGPLQPGFSPLPANFHYTIVGGTGAYQHLHGQGQMSLVLIPAPIAVDQPPRGAFRMTFS